MRSICTAVVATLALVGTSFSATINVPADYPTIQEAIDASEDGDTILISDGVYSEVLDIFLDHSLTIRSESGPESAIIFPDPSSSEYETAIDIQCLSDDIVIRFEGLQLFNHNGSGIYASPNYFASEVVVENCIIRKCTGRYGPSPLDRVAIVRAICQNGIGQAILRNCRIEGNTFRALLLSGLGAQADNCVANGNHYFTESGNSWLGGAAEIQDHAAMSGCVIRDNSCRTEFESGAIALGAGIYSSGITYMYANVVCGNRFHNVFGSLIESTQFWGGFIGSGNLFSEDCESEGPINGACCLQTSCVQTDLYSCILSNGIFKGVASECSEVDCSNEGNLGACCIGGSCSPTNEYTCISLGGEWAGDYTICDDVNCTPPLAIAACCVSDACLTTTLELCEALEGLWQGDESDCKSATCESWIGACCVSDACTEITLEDCADLGGTYFGDLSSCTDLECPGTCLGDLNGDSDVSVDDILILISGYGPCP